MSARRRRGREWANVDGVLDDYAVPSTQTGPNKSKESPVTEPLNGTTPIVVPMTATCKHPDHPEKCGPYSECAVIQ